MNAEYRGFSPLNILLAEDERAVAFSIAFALKCDGHTVQVVAEGGQALASVRVALLEADEPKSSSKVAPESLQPPSLRSFGEPREETERTEVL